MSIFFANKSASFEEVRARASKFASDRDWNQFHTPTNITLAMAGECGEVCEIFQFKGNLDTFDLHNNSNLSSSEIVHAGEEISDVLIYLTRLCTVCDIDLSACIQQKIEGSIVDAVKEDGTPTSPPPRANQVTKEWIDFPYSKIEKYTSNISKLKSKNPRYYCLKLQSHIGALCNLFARGEHFCDFNLTNWSIPELLEFSSLAATISLTMFSLAHILNLEVGTCIADKMDKNERKYPAEMVKGSAKKYNEYKNSDSQDTSTDLIDMNNFLGIGLTAGTAVASACVGVLVESNFGVIRALHSKYFR